MTKAKAPVNHIDPSTLRIVDEPYKDGRSSPVSKYEPIFSKVQPNQRIVCPAGTGSRLAAQFRKWLQNHGNKNVVVRARDRCEDGMGGVWWIKEAEKPRTALAPNALWPAVRTRKAA